MRRNLLLRDLLLRYEAYADLEVATTRLAVDETELDDIGRNLDKLDVVVRRESPLGRAAIGQSVGAVWLLDRCRAGCTGNDRE